MLILHQIDPQRFRHNLPRQIITRRPQPPSDDQRIRPIHHLLDRLPNRIAIRHRRLPRHPQPHQKKLTPKPPTMSVKRIS